MANGDRTEIDYEALLDVAKGFTDSSDLLKNIDDFIEGLLAALKSEFFIGLISATMFEAYTTAVRTRIQTVIGTFNEMSDDLKRVVPADILDQLERKTKYTS